MYNTSITTRQNTTSKIKIKKQVKIEHIAWRRWELEESVCSAEKVVEQLRKMLSALCEKMLNARIYHSLQKINEPKKVYASSKKVIIKMKRHFTLNFKFFLPLGEEASRYVSVHLHGEKRLGEKN